MTSAITQLDQRFHEANAPALTVPAIATFRQFMEEHAKVRVGSEFVQYTTVGREPLALVIAIIDYVLGNDVSYVPDDVRMELFGTLDYGKIITDAHIYVCGGAQFGKTILSLHLKQYLSAIRWMHSYYVLPDNDLVSAIIDGKERPEVLDQIPWLNQMITIGKEVNESGKTVNRKGAMLYTDGKHSAMSYMRGMNKIPTSISADCVIQDESDDIDPEKSKFLPGRMTASDLRLFVGIGTQRYHGAGQNKLLEDGSKLLGDLICLACGTKMNPEETWPQIARMAMDGKPSTTDPQLSYEGNFKRGTETIADFDHDAVYYMACTHCGDELDREAIKYTSQKPLRIKARRWSIRVSQMCCSGLSLKMIIADWCQNAVRDPDAMVAFACDRLAIPKSAAQQVEPSHLAKARSLEEFTLSLTPSPKTLRYGGMDTGDRCWFISREIHSDAAKRISWAEQLSPERCRERIPALFNTLELSCLFIDIGAERSLTRDLCLVINGLQDWDAPQIDNPENAYIHMPGGVAWDGPNNKWHGIKCAAVEFSRKPGSGIVHKLGINPDGNRYYPIIQCNRDEVIGQAVRELLTAEDGVIELIDGALRTEPVLRLPQMGSGAQAIAQSIDAHFLAGSCTEKDAKGAIHYVGKKENHLLLAAAYARLAETIGGTLKPRKFEYSSVAAPSGTVAKERSLVF